MENILSLSAYELAAQAIGIIAMTVAILSFQCKKTSRLCLMQAVSGGLFGINFFLLGAFSGAILNFINVFRGILFAVIPQKHRKLTSVLLCVAYVIATVLSFGTPFFFNGLFSTLACTAQLLGTVMMCIGDGKKLRIAQLSVVSPVWLAHNIYYFSLGGIICETFSIVSVIVSMVRFRGGKFEK